MKAEEDDLDYLTQAEVSEAIACISDADYRRFEKQSAFMSYSVPGMTDSDLFHEALIRLQIGQRQWRRGVDLGKTVYMIMVSIARDARKQAKTSPIDRFAVATEGGGGDDDEETRQESGVAIAAGTPEDLASFHEMFSMLEKLVAGDSDEEAVLLSWAVGCSAKEAADQAGISMKDYDSARKRVDRKIAAVKKQTGQ